ncbi:benzoylformate decarboxylase [Tomitella gaofuii]|uniref:benzoylformate decarboxylase n=1 Tax=Tomitella gaofuii TaxID=2760083 RepID=UPI0015FCFEA3|nr:benzoylformate decarboxylase [Tomitella gaofuii]
MGQTIRDVTFQLMRELNLTTIFGNPGSTEETFLKNYPADFRYIQALQEASAVAIADGYAQATRRPAVVNVHTAAGVANAMSNIMTASMNQTPLIITAGNQTREMLLMEPWLMNVQPEDLPKPWVKWSYEPVRAADVPAAFMRAYAAALQPPAGPVFLSIPLDDWDQPAAGSNPVVRTVATRVGPDPVRIAEFARALSDAKDPALIFGASIARGDGWGQAVTLAEKLGVHVYAAPASERPPFPEDHPLYVGGLPFAIGPLSKKLAGHDVAIVIGAPVFRYYPFVAGDYLPDGLRLLHVTEDPAQAARAPVGDSLVSDAVLATEALTGLIPGRPHRTVEKQPHRMAPHGAGVSVREDSRMGADELFATLYDAMPEDAVVVEESPSNLGDFHAAWPIVKPDSFYTFASGSLGWNLPAAVGLALAERDSGRNRPVIAMIGDGSMQYAVQGLHSAAQEQLPILYVIPRNGEYAILKSFADLEDSPGVPGLDIPGLDVVALAKGYGCTGERAETAEEVRAAVARALGRPGPTVLEVPIEAKVPPLL